jgi:hypothetical protein
VPCCERGERREKAAALISTEQKLYSQDSATLVATVVDAAVKRRPLIH